jgi:hypothetical protein
MKTPRITDFDPDAKVPTLKSSLDSMPSIQKPHHITTPPDRQTTPPRISTNTQPHTAKPTKTLPVSTSRKRLYVRRTFDFYDDQITYLTRRSLEERLAGREISMNEMVREALDDWIQKQTSKK